MGKVCRCCGQRHWQAGLLCAAAAGRAGVRVLQSCPRKPPTAAPLVYSPFSPSQAAAAGLGVSPTTVATSQQPSACSTTSVDGWEEPSSLLRELCRAHAHLML